ncbi:hypothetical protein A2U01_0055855, partial [Trifolium medium]|nr:hypothetical protein [Trifolium medium]
MSGFWPSAPPLCQLSGNTAFMEWSFAADLKGMYWGFWSSSGGHGAVPCFVHGDMVLSGGVSFLSDVVHYWGVSVADLD